ncbi:MAG: DUF1648 domain-containing protein [Bacteroidales bacterium]|nr:DUF1648 domain-containing protein [Bacteroidales bacterium]HPY82899.1 SdpI family protein [Bacteroidales bacterium]
MNKYFKELVLWIFIALPYVYLAKIWNELPEIVPTHFNLEGVADGWSKKQTLLYIPAALGVGMYLLMLIIPFLDPKKKIQQMEGKYYVLRFMLTFFFSLLTLFLLYVSKEETLNNPAILFVIIGVFFAMFGNYFQTVRPNYFIGIRTPWTLENEQVWKKTHRLGGRIWLVGGVSIAILAFFVTYKIIFTILFVLILSFMVVVPVLYSYIEFKKIKKA